MEAQTSEAPGARDQAPWHKWVLYGAALGCAWLIADAGELRGFLEWALIFLFGIGAAAAGFWGSRKAAWYWPTVGMIVIAHVLALYAVNWQPLSGGETGMRLAMKGGWGGDLVVNLLVFYVCRQFFDPATVAKTQPAAVAKAIKLGFAILALVVPLALTLLVLHSRQGAPISP